jgi:hypothetical protein
VTKHLLILRILLKAATEFLRRLSSSVISLFFLSHISYPALGLFPRIIGGFRNNFVVKGSFLKSGISLLMRISVRVFRIIVLSLFIEAAETLFFNYLHKKKKCEISALIQKVQIKFLIPSNSVADSCHFGVDPDPRIHASD